MHFGNGHEGLVDRALAGDAHQVLLLFLGEVAAENDAAMEVLDVAFVFVFAVMAVFCVDTLVFDLDGDLFERVLLPSRVHLDGHGGAGAEGPGEQFVGRRAEVVATEILGFIGDQRDTGSGHQLGKVVIGEGLGDNGSHGMSPVVGEWGCAGCRRRR